uniref:Uncharacterized protein n=1 Tax=Anguilla anguilla TaxID=7936 RepID=A0A0E9SGK8_ANGAN
MSVCGPNQFLNYFLKYLCFDILLIILMMLCRLQVQEMNLNSQILLKYN